MSVDAVAAVESGAVAPLPLDGLRVVELGGSIATAFCGKLLAAFGAEVLKVEPPGGDPCRSLGPFVGDRPSLEASLPHLYLNTSKLGLTLDPSQATGRSLLTRLLGQSDVLLDGLGAGRLAELGLPPGALTALSRRLITVAVSDFGEDGPYRDYLGGELIVLALGGLLYMVGEPEREPLRLGGYQAQHVTGLSAFTAVMTALYARDLYGIGQRVELAVQESVAFTEWKSGIYYQSNQKVRRRGGRDAQWLILRASDGFLAFVYQDEHWPKVRELVGNPALDDERFTTRAKRIQYRDEIRPLLEAWSIRRTKLEGYHQAQAFGIPVGMVADAADVVNSPQYSERGYFELIDHPSTGPVRYPGLPCTFDGQRPRSRRAPLLGEHNPLIYSERLGLSQADQVRLRERRVS